MAAGWQLSCKRGRTVQPPVVASIEECAGCNVVLIVIDTLRADHLPFYGYPRDTAPFLQSVAEKSSVFERGFAASSWTAPATASIFTAFYPSRHWVITGLAATKSLQKGNPDTQIKLNRLPSDMTTLGEFMSRAGYRTIGVADNPNIGDAMGFSRGFERFVTHRNVGAQEVGASARRFLNEIGTTQPYFLYLHYMDPHQPYHRHEPWHSECVATIPGGKTNRPERTICSYDSEIRFTDTQIAPLFTEYRWLENSIVIVTADHGEEFWDHGGTGHGKTLYTEAIHVPFIVYHPKWPGRRIGANVQTTDIMPTLAHLMGLAPEARWEGKSIRAQLHGESPADPERGIFSERIRHEETNQAAKRSIVMGEWHYIETNDHRKNDLLLDSELYGLKSDFRERDELEQQQSEVAARLGEQLREHKRRAAAPKKENQISVPVDKELSDQLRSLGYIQ